jgi:hypothetical protein
MDRATPSANLPVFWPLFPYDTMPIKEGEHAYVMFEDSIKKQHGVWLCRAPEPLNIEGKEIDNLNLVLGSDKFKAYSR